MADTLVKKPKLIVGTQSQVKAEMGDNDIGFATDIEFYNKTEIDEQYTSIITYVGDKDREIKSDITQLDTNIRTVGDWVNAKDSEGNRATLTTEAQDAYRAINELNAKIGEGGGGASLPILMSMWSDHVINDMSWLRADTFSWQSGDVYKAAYEHLVADMPEEQMLYAWDNDIDETWYTKTPDVPAVGDILYWDDGQDSGRTVASVSGDTFITSDGGRSYSRYPAKDTVVKGTTKTDTIGDITITYYLAQDGHKICLPDQESNLIALYEATGVAWYFILDTDNKQFKLPRTKYGFTGLRDSVGGYVAPGLPNVEGDSGIVTTTGVPTGAFSRDGAKAKTWNTDSSNTYAGTTFDASRSNSIYGASDTVQPAATQMYLYFYVGNFEQSAVEQTAGLNTELFNGKADVDLNNINPSNSAKATIVGWGMPDYTAGVSISGTTFTAPCDCFIAFYVGASVQNGGGGSINVDGVVIDSLATTSCTVAGFKHAWVAKGSVVELVRGAGGNTANYYPLKGAI